MIHRLIEASDRGFLHTRRVQPEPERDLQPRRMKINRVYTYFFILLSHARANNCSFVPLFQIPECYTALSSSHLTLVARIIVFSDPYNLFWVNSHC
jgi:hypothetical protein